jgi:hypothetical protein
VLSVFVIRVVFLKFCFDPGPKTTIGLIHNAVDIDQPPQKTDRCIQFQIAHPIHPSVVYSISTITLRYFLADCDQTLKQIQQKNKNIKKQEDSINHPFLHHRFYEPFYEMFSTPFAINLTYHVEYYHPDYS